MAEHAVLSIPVKVQSANLAMKPFDFLDPSPKGPPSTESTGSRAGSGRSAARAIALAAGLLLAAAHGVQAAMPDGVLVVHSNQRPTVAALIIDDGLRKALSDRFEHPAALYAEYLDAESPSIGSFGAAAADFLRGKYGGRNIRVIVASAPQALQFVLEHRDRLLPGVPIVHVAIPRERLAQMKVPADVVGRPIDLDPAPTLALAARLHPDARRLVIVLGAAERDRVWERRVRAALERLEAPLEVEYVSGLPTAEVLRRVGALPRDAIVFTPGYFVDGAGRVETPHRSLELIAPASAAPVYGPLSTFVGTGVVGGHVTPYDEQARQAGALVVALLRGLPTGVAGAGPIERVTMVDWRQIRRWGIDEKLLPPGTIVKFREPSAWDRYRWEIIGAAAIVLFQAALIFGLVFERNARRRAAEQAAAAKTETGRYREDLAHVVRVHTAGEMSVALAHEITQPLGAIENYALAARRRLKGEPPDLAHVADLLDKVVGQTARAGDVVTRMRGMVQRHQLEPKEVDVARAVRDCVEMVRTDCELRDIRIEFEAVGRLPPIVADEIHLQQVILNLLRNAMEAVERPEPGVVKRVTVGVGRDDAGAVSVAVADRGPGIAEGDLERVFEPFYSTKPRGLGIGLAIGRKLIEAHGGALWAAHNPGGGAVLRFTLPVVPSVD